MADRPLRSDDSDDSDHSDRPDRPDRQSRAGVVLAGGYATRFGDRDKAVADLAGVPMVRRTTDRLAEVTDAVVVNCRREQVPALREALAGRDDVALAPDPTPDRGPLAGIATGLAVLDATSVAYTAVVACDMPLVDPALLAYLFDRAEGHDAALVRTDDGWFQPTQAVYRIEAMRCACADALDEENPRVLSALDDLDAVVIDEAEVDSVASMRSLTDVNTAEELATVAESLADE
ncbi:molybdenum cofactor guanylyltransferase [Salinirubrum litoreum]|uniref:Probable molybdenum cofactor guanylyltransferase n=1 Tax=Salinirubrum litoreum TaxID=1126234 RepID=A0ABD5R6G4_9EURY|nr:molybdenum cofactor guanylyltransferase [Salinirubrum litoreum]